MKLEELIPGKKYKLADLYVGEFVAKDNNNAYFNIEGEHNFLVESEYDSYPGTVGIRYQEELVKEL